MHAGDGVFLEDLCPKLRARSWRRSLHHLTGGRCLYCGARSESIDHVHPRSRGGASVTENCVPACLACNGRKGDNDAFHWDRQQPFYDPRRAMALRAWTEGDLRLAERLLAWTQPAVGGEAATAPGAAAGTAPASGGEPRRNAHQTRQAASPLWRWQIAS